MAEDDEIVVACTSLIFVSLAGVMADARKRKWKHKMWA